MTGTTYDYNFAELGQFMQNQCGFSSHASYMHLKVIEHFFDPIIQIGILNCINEYKTLDAKYRNSASFSRFKSTADFFNKFLEKNEYLVFIMNMIESKKVTVDVFEDFINNHLGKDIHTTPLGVYFKEFLDGFPLYTIIDKLPELEGNKEYDAEKIKQALSGCYLRATKFIIELESMSQHHHKIRMVHLTSHYSN